MVGIVAGVGKLALGAAKGGVNFAKSISSGGLADLSGGLSAFSTLVGGIADRNQKLDEAYQAEREAVQADIRGRQETNQILDQSIDTIAKNRVAFGAAGVDVTTGSSQDFQRENVKDTDRGIRIARFDAETRQLQLERRARQLRSAGAFSLFQGIVGSAAQGTEVLANRKARNTPKAASGGTP